MDNRDGVVVMAGISVGYTKMSIANSRFSENASASLNGLVGRTGVVGGTLRLPDADEDGRMSIYAASVGNLAAVLDGVRTSTRGKSTWGTIDGAGGAFDPADARLLSIAEGLERYASCVYDERQFIWATARELGREAVDLSQFPTVSESETKRNPAWVAPNIDAPMRWVKSVCMLTGEVRWIPAMAVYLHLPFASIGERFTVPISTGCALHTDAQMAIRNAILEVIERDAVALTWLQKIRWPRFDMTLLSDSDEVKMALTANSAEEMHFFNATTDLGVPTIYGVSVSPNHPTVRQVVVAVTSWDFDSAIIKLVREAISCRIALEHRRLERTDPTQFHAVHDGALYMASPERSSAFDFLLDDSLGSRGAAQTANILKSDVDGAEAVRWLLGILKERGMDAYAVNLTCREVDDAGFFCVRVVIPQLMPLSFVHNAQFRGSNRLYAAPANMGYIVHKEEDLNPWPQPFA